MGCPTEDLEPDADSVVLEIEVGSVETVLGIEIRNPAVVRLSDADFVFLKNVLRLEIRNPDVVRQSEVEAVFLEIEIWPVETGDYQSSSQV